MVVERGNDGWLARSGQFKVHNKRSRKGFRFEEITICPIYAANAPEKPPNDSIAWVKGTDHYQERLEVCTLCYTQKEVSSGALHKKCHPAVGHTRVPSQQFKLGSYRVPANIYGPEELVYSPPSNM